MRRNWRNDGRNLQEMIKASCEAYRSRGLGKIEQVIPPGRVVFDKNRPKVPKFIPQANPFLDFIGTYSGRCVSIEAKSTKKHRLAIGGSGGIRKKQCDAIIEWLNAGAITFVIWEFEGKHLYVPGIEVIKALERGEKSLVAERFIPIPQGESFCLIDFASHPLFVESFNNKY